MTPEQRAAYVHAQAACMEVEAVGMVAENIAASRNGLTAPYERKDFLELIIKYDLHHNALMTFFHE